MKYDAVIFDLFGTLVDNLHHEEFLRILGQMAALVHAPEQAFAQMWNVDTWPMRATGELPTVEAAIEYICRELGVPTVEEQLQAAARLRSSYTRSELIPRHDTVETLTLLRSAGYKIGLISDCTLEVPRYWSETPLAPLIDVPIFSCSVGLKKPDPRIYLLACEQLGVTPQKCLYMGDGGSNELTGASNVGMYPVLIRAPYETLENVHRHNEDTWSEPRISTVKEILVYVDEALVA